jgi:hypothetical protein
MNKDQTQQAQAQTTEQQAPKFDHVKFIKECGTKSAAIRKLSQQGKTRGEISKLLEIRYQHVRNVLITPVTKPKA